MKNVTIFGVLQSNFFGKMLQTYDLTHSLSKSLNGCVSSS